MSGAKRDVPRRLLPRWRYRRETILTADYAGSPYRVRSRVPDTTSMIDALRDWTLSPSIPTAAEVVAVAVATKVVEPAKRAASYLLARKTRLPASLARAASEVINQNDSAPPPNKMQIADNPFDDSGQVAGLVIRDARLSLRENPRLLSRYLDLARAYMVLGHNNKAEEAIRAALALAPNNRVVLRLAARFYLHKGQLGRAYSLICRHPRTPTDPWLIATEFSLASIKNSSPRWFRKGRALLEGGTLDKAHQTELAAAFGTLEWENGHPRHARKYFRQSLAVPNDNVVAQVKSVLKNDASASIPSDYFNLPGSHEAQYLRARDDEDFRLAIEKCGYWLLDETYSSRPAIEGSYLALVALDDSGMGEQFARTGLRADPDDQILRNNLAVALAYKGKTDEAEKEFARIRRPLSANYSETTFLATKGLLEYRKGFGDRGRVEYSKALEKAAPVQQVLLLAHWAREEILIKGEMADSLVQRAVKAIKHRSDDVAIKKMVDGLKRRMRGIPVLGQLKKSKIA